MSSNSTLFRIDLFLIKTVHRFDLLLSSSLPHVSQEVMKNKLQSLLLFWGGDVMATIT